MLLFISLEFNFVSSSYFTGANVSPPNKQILSTELSNIIPVKICSVIQGVVQVIFFHLNSLIGLGFSQPLLQTCGLHCFP